MGFFKKIFKGVGKVFKKIGRGIKKAVGKFGKFMGKAGILGQVAMAFILPGIGSALGSMVGAAAASANPLLAAAGKVLQFAGKVASAPGKIFSSITNGVTSTLTEFSKTALSKMGFEGKLVEGAAESYFFGADSAASRVGTAIKAPFTEKALLDAASKTADEYITSDNVDAILDDVSKLETPTTTQSIFKASPEDFAKNAEMVTAQTPKPVKTFTETLKDTGTEILGDAVKTVQGKVESLSDPKKLAKTGFEMFRDMQTEEQRAAEQAAMFGGQVIDVGIYQDPSSFLTFESQNAIAPVQTFQPTASYTQPMASWAQQFMYQPDVNVGAFANTSYDRFSNASYDRGF